MPNDDTAFPLGAPIRSPPPPTPEWVKPELRRRIEREAIERGPKHTELPLPTVPRKG